MSTTISNSVQSHSVMQKGVEKPDLENRRAKTENSQDHDSENEIKGAKEAQKPVKEAVGLTKSEIDFDLIKFATVHTLLKDTNKVETVATLFKDTNKLPVDQVYKLGSGSIVDLVA